MQRLAPLLVLALVSGCRAKPEPKLAYNYVRSEPAVDPPRPKPVVIEVPQLPAPKGQMKPIPPTEPKIPTITLRPIEIVADANRKATQSPDESGFFNAVMQYSFAPASLYEVYASPFHVTDIVLQPGERILGQPASGDVVRWVLAMGKSAEKGLEQWHVYLKPTRPNLETNLAINTDRRTYLLELRSFPDTYMASVKWHYPQDELAHAEASLREQDALEKNAAPVVSLDALNFHYAIELANGAPRWTPVQVFDDGRKTFIRFPHDMLVREAPALFVLRDKETQLVNYRVKGDYYVVDRLFDAAELRVGQQNQEIVRLRRSAK